MNIKHFLVGMTAVILVGCSTNDETLSGQTVDGGLADSAIDSAQDATGLGSEDINAQDLAGQPEPGTQSDLEINVGDRVFFGYDSVALNADAQETLTRQAAWLQQFPSINARIEGHTDERGTTEYNLALGEQRAASVKNFLTALGIDPARLLVISYGEERPEDPGHDEAAWALNRRSVTVIDVIN